MLGAVKRRQTDHEVALAGAWWGSVFERSKRLKPLGHYLKIARGQKQSANEVAATFEAMQSRGLKVRVRKVPLPSPDGASG